jgi:hypothetical protein
MDGETAERKNNNEFMRNRYRLQQFQIRSFERINNLETSCVILEEIHRQSVIEYVTQASANGPKSESDIDFSLMIEIPFTNSWSFLP